MAAKKPRSPRTAPVEIGRYLVLTNGVELQMVTDALTDQASFERALIDVIRDHNVHEEADKSVHILTVARDGGLSMSDFSSDFMDQMRDIAFGDEAGANEGTEEN